MTYNRDALIELIQAEALAFGDFTLASGKKASFYLDCRKVTLHSAGAALVGAGMLDAIETRFPGDAFPYAVGGMAIGADPIVGAVITTAALRGRELRGFIVRKESKTHGTGSDVEGHAGEGASCVIAEDVVTTGGSALKAIEKVRARGMNVIGAIAIVDRLAGGQEAFAAVGVPLMSLLTIRDLGIEG